MVEIIARGPMSRWELLNAVDSVTHVVPEAVEAVGLREYAGHSYDRNGSSGFGRLVFVHYTVVLCLLSRVRSCSSSIGRT